MSSVTFDAVSKRYGDVTAVADLDLAIDDGEFMVLLGPSGCGKTTALRMIAGLEDISEGTLRIGDRVVNDVDPARRDISMVFQSYALYPHMTVRRNIESPLLARRYHVDGPDQPARKLTSTERAERVAEAARVLGLEPYLTRKPAALSGANVSGWPWHAPLSAARRRSSWTSRCRTSTPSCGRRPASSSSSSTSGSARPSSP